MPWPGRPRDIPNVIPDAHSVDLPSLLERLSQLSVRGLSAMYDPRTRSFPHTVRGSGADRLPVARGMSVRYTAIAALGVSRLDASTRREVLSGHDLPELLPGILGLALAGRDCGALALSVWATLEVTSASADDDRDGAERNRLVRALDRLLENVRTGAPVPTVDHAWTLVALVEAGRSDETVELAGGFDRLADATHRAARRLLDAQGSSGLFPHHLPVDRLGRLRSHVSCFCDQAYPIQALARYAAATGSLAALKGAGRCADRIAVLQGDQGQWWWHYDWRHATVVERYPVYSANQHAVAPMALMELREAGGRDHRAAVEAGVSWLTAPPESTAGLIADELGVVWRKVGRRDPSKIVRKLRSVASAPEPGLRLTWLDLVFPPGSVDRECRPFELGWLLYAWHAGEPLVPRSVEVLGGFEAITGAVRFPRPIEHAGGMS
jgi:hypothetical protein